MVDRMSFGDTDQMYLKTLCPSLLVQLVVLAAVLHRSLLGDLVLLTRL